MGWCVAAVLASGIAVAQPAANDTDESAYAPATLARIMGGVARAQNDEAELGAAGEWYTTTATFTGRRRPISGRYRPIVGAWLSSRGEGQDAVDMYFAGELKELEFEQGGKKHWVLAGLPGGLGFDVYGAGQKLTLYLQRIGFASGTPVAVMTLAKLPGGVTSATVRSGGRRMRNARVGEGARRQEATYRSGTATFTYAGREYTLPLDPAGRHSIAPGIYAYENGVRTALLEYGAGDDRYLLLRVPAGDQASDVVPYLVLNGRIVPPIDVSGCNVDVDPVQKAGARGTVDCSASQRVVLSKLRFDAQ